MSKNPNTNNNPTPISNPAIANRSCNFLLYLQTHLWRSCANRNSKVTRNTFTLVIPDGCRVATRPGFPRFVPCCPASRQDLPWDAKCPGFQGKVKMTKIIIIITIVIIDLAGARTRGLVKKIKCATRLQQRHFWLHCKSGLGTDQAWTCSTYIFPDVN